ncbi:unnamed protein product, partial [Larinioides sclopetarius]
ALLPACFLFAPPVFFFIYFNFLVSNRSFFQKILILSGVQWIVALPHPSRNTF